MSQSVRFGWTGVKIRKKKKNGDQRWAMGMGREETRLKSFRSCRLGLSGPKARDSFPHGVVAAASLCSNVGREHSRGNSVQDWR